MAREMGCKKTEETGESKKAGRNRVVARQVGSKEAGRNRVVVRQVGSKKTEWEGRILEGTVGSKKDE